MRIGSLFSGAGGLDMAVEEVFGGEVIWQCEMDKAASKVLAYRYPCAPNLGDITAVDWSTVETPDILCGGFPCQDVSAAGKRAGIKDGTRSGLWSVFADIIDTLRPRIVVIENVRGLLSAKAHRNLESDRATLGDGTDGPVLRAAGAVLGDLANLGYDAQWATVAAGDVGAPHRRERVFIVATDSNQVGPEGCGLPNGMGSTLSPSSGGQLSLCGTCGHEQRLHCDYIGRCTKPCECPGFAAPDSSGIGRHEGRPESARIVGGSDAAVSGDADGRLDLLLTPTTQDGANNGGPSQFERNTLPLNAEVMLLTTATADNGWCEQCWMDYDSPTCLCDEFGYIQGQGASEPILLPTPRTRDGKGATSSRSGDNKHDLPSALADSDLTGPLWAQGKADDIGKPPSPGPVSQTSWGKYEPAIRRWESLTRPAPAPTEPNKNGNPRLSAAFSEWLMGWPDGWVTDPDIGISRNDQLRIVGNGVCPQQAAAALRYLLSVCGVAA